MERAIKKKNCNTKPANAAGPIQHQRGTTTSENRTSLATKGFAVIHVGNKEGRKPSKTLGKQNIDKGDAPGRPMCITLGFPLFSKEWRVMHPVLTGCITFIYRIT